MSFGGGGTVFGGPGGEGFGGVSVPLSSILKPMLRIAGITVLANTTPNEDQYSELIPLVNRLLASWSCDGHRIYSRNIDSHPLVDGQKVYTIGPSGELDQPRPIAISGAAIVFPTSPELRRELYVMDDDEWRSISVQDISGAPPYSIYYDGSLDESGLGRLYVYFQPPSGYSLELWTWLQLPSFVTADDIVILPPGYERALVLNGALEVAELYPLEAKISRTVEWRAQQALHVLIALNSNSPKIGTESILDRDQGSHAYGWLDGPFR